MSKSLLESYCSVLRFTAPTRTLIELHTHTPTSAGTVGRLLFMDENRVWHPGALPPAVSRRTYTFNIKGSLTRIHNDGHAHPTPPAPSPFSRRTWTCVRVDLWARPSVSAPPHHVSTRSSTVTRGWAGGGGPLPPRNSIDHLFLFTLPTHNYI